jgi:prepilin-type N-terminal cleavage/methylation domain-containing protein
MKTTTEKLPVADRTPAWHCRLPLERQDAGPLFAPIANRSAFTLIELLVVIAVMAILAGFTLTVIGQIKKTEYIKSASGELGQIQSALEDYKNQYGSYPPSNPNLSPLVNTLYYELSGVTLNAANQTYTTLDGACSISQSAYGNAFRAGSPPTTIDGIINCTQGAGDEQKSARNFLVGLKANRLGTSSTTGQNITNLITAMRGPDGTYKPLGVQDVNPFRYAYPGTNNPSSYDLWIQLVINGKTNLICNWTKQVIVNSPLP